MSGIEADRPRACPEQHALAAHIRHCFETEDLRVDTEQLRHYLSLARYFPYERLFPWQECLTALWNCTYTAEGRPRWKTLFCMVGRGAGKDGYIAFDAMCSTSPYNPVSRYNVDICANNEEQAMTPVLDLVNTLELPKNARQPEEAQPLLLSHERAGAGPREPRRHQGSDQQPEGPRRYALGQGHFQRGPPV